MSRAPQGVRALLWLKSREWLSESRDPSRLILLGLLLLAWFALIVVGTVQAVHTGRLENAPRDLLFIAAAAWPLWAVIPLLGGGGGEVTAAHRLAPYPVSAEAVFGGAWATALLDVPYLIVLPVVLGLSTAYAGLAGFVAALAFVAGASATGQLMAWASFLAMSGRRHTGLSAVLLTAGVVGLLGALPTLLPAAVDVSTVLPGGWLRSAAAASVAGDWLLYLSWVVLLLSPAPIALVLGPVLTRRARDSEARSGGVGARPWGTAGWSVQGSMRRALFVANLRSMTRAVGAQVALAGVLAVPTITQLPGVEVATVSLIAMGGVAGIAGATVLGVNAFAFDAGGAAAMLSWPVRLADVVVAKAAAVALMLLTGQLAVTVLGALVLGSPWDDVAPALVLCFARTAGLTGIALIWSVRMPAPSDYDSLRARISTPGAIASYAFAAAIVTYGVSQLAQHLTGVSGALMVVVVFVGIGVAGLRMATDQFHAGGLERVASGVLG